MCVCVPMTPLAGNNAPTLRDSSALQHSLSTLQLPVTESHPCTRPSLNYLLRKLVPDTHHPLCGKVAHQVPIKSFPLRLEPMSKTRSMKWRTNPILSKALMIKPKVSGRSLKRLHILPLFFVPTTPIAKLLKEAVFRLHSSVVAINSFCQPLRLFASTSGRTFHKTIKAVEYLCCTKIFLIITGQPSLT